MTGAISNTPSPRPNYRREPSQNELTAKRALEWAKIAANNLQSGQKVLRAHGWGHDPFAGPLDDVLNLVGELQKAVTQYQNGL